MQPEVITVTDDSSRAELERAITALHARAQAGDAEARVERDALLGLWSSASAE